MSKYITSPFFLPFVLAFFLVLNFTMKHSMLTGGDSYSIWQTITSFDHEKITASYVLYKGFISIYPYIFFVSAAGLLSVDPFLLVKLYHSILFAFVSAIGIPFVVANMLGIKVKLYKNIIFVFLFFHIAKFTNVFTMVMVDLPTFAIYVSVACLFFLLRNRFYNKKICFISGLFVGLLFCSSGQYSLSGFIFLFLFVITILQSNCSENFSRRKRVVLLVVFLCGVIIPKVYDNHFHQEIVEPMRARGEWLPTGQQWMISGMTRLMDEYKNTYPSRSNRGLAIIKEREGKDFKSKYEIMNNGGGMYSVDEYIEIVFSHPVDFLAMWTTKAFLLVSFDGGKASVKYLFFSYTALFICLCLVYYRCRIISDLINSKSFIILSMVTTVAAPIFLYVEMRYGLCLFGFILGFAIHQDDLTLEKLYKNVIGFKFKLSVIAACGIPYLFILYLFFVIILFSFYGALLEGSGSEPTLILFK